MDTMLFAVLSTAEIPNQPHQVVRWLGGCLPRGWRLQESPQRWQRQRDGYPLGLLVPGNGSPREIERATEDFAESCRRADLEDLVLGPEVLLEDEAAEEDRSRRPGRRGGSSDREESQGSAGPAIAALVVLGGGAAALATGVVSLEQVSAGAAALGERASQLVESVRG